MGYVKIKVLEKGTSEDLLRWKEHMLEEPKCWNKFCLGCYDKSELQSVHVSKDGNELNQWVGVCDALDVVETGHVIFLYDVFPEFRQDVFFIAHKCLIYWLYLSFSP